MAYFIDIKPPDGGPMFAIDARGLDDVRVIDPATRQPYMIVWKRYGAGWTAKVDGVLLFARERAE